MTTPVVVVVGEPPAPDPVVVSLESQQLAIRVTEQQPITLQVAERGQEGPPGPAGDTGPAGPGVPTGGSAEQVLTKVSGADYDTTWRSIPEITVSSTEPATPTFNDVWLDIS